MTASAIPADPSGLTAGWLTGTLRDAGVIQNARVVKIDAEVIGEDRGFTGVVARLRLAYDHAEPGAPPSLVAKFPLAERSAASSYRDAQAADAQRSRAYLERCAREVSFYRLIAPRTSLAPRVYFARADPEAGRLLLLIEDLSDGQMGDALRGCGVEQARAVVDLIAAFHAQWWGQPALDGLDWLPLWSKDPATSAERFGSQSGPFVDRYGDRIPSEVRSLIPRLQDGYEAILRNLNGPPVTMIHADLHLDNLIFTPAGREPAVKVLDWQSVARGSCAVDLAHFIAGSLDIPTRRSAEQDLLRRYHEILTACGVSGFGFDDLLSGYRRSLLWQLAGTAGWLCRTELDDLEGRERQLVEAIFTDGWLFAALQDHHAELLALF